MERKIRQESRYLARRVCVLIGLVGFLFANAPGSAGASGSRTFSDIPAGHWADKAVGWAVGEGITVGVSADSFAPDHPVTRAEVVALLYRARGEPLSPPGSESFTDVPVGHWADKAIGWAFTEGLVRDTTDDLYRLNASVPRAQAVSLLYRAEGEPPVGRHPAVAFTDVPPDHAAADAILWADTKGITHGVGNDLFGPNRTVTRAQFVTFLFRLHLGDVQEALGKVISDLNAGIQTLDDIVVPEIASQIDLSDAIVPGSILSYIDGTVEVSDDTAGIVLRVTNPIGDVRFYLGVFSYRDGKWWLVITLPLAQR